MIVYMDDGDLFRFHQSYPTSGTVVKQRLEKISYDYDSIQSKGFVLSCVRVVHNFTGSRNDMLLTNVTYLKCAHGFNKELHRDMFPQSLVRLDLGKSFQ